MYLLMSGNGEVDIGRVIHGRGPPADWLVRDLAGILQAGPLPYLLL